MSQGSVNTGSNYITNAYLGSTTVKGIYLGNTQVWPPPLPEVTTYMRAGSYTYTLPSWFRTGRDLVDVAVIGGGGGGGAYSFFQNGTKGAPGSWGTYSSYSPSGNLSVVVGAGGLYTFASSGKAGSASTVKYSTTTIASGAGGAGGPAAGNAWQSANAGSRTINGVVYRGGQANNDYGNSFGTMGSGGTGSNNSSYNAGNGGDGAVYIRAYTPMTQPTPRNTVTYDNTGAGGFGTVSTNGANKTWTHSVGANAGVIMIYCHYATNVGLPEFTGWIGSTQMDLIAENHYFSYFNSNNPLWLGIKVWGIVNPPSGSQTMKVQAVGAYNANYINANSFSYNYARGFSEPQMSLSKGTTKSLTFTGSSSGNRVICGHADMEQVGNSQSNNQTLRYFKDAGFLSNPDLLVQDAAGGSTISFTTSNAANWYYGTVGIEIEG